VSSQYRREGGGGVPISVAMHAPWYTISSPGPYVSRYVTRARGISTMWFIDSRMHLV
jgi:hypothetical protein